MKKIAIITREELYLMIPKEPLVKLTPEQREFMAKNGNLFRRSDIVINNWNTGDREFYKQL